MAFESQNYQIKNTFVEHENAELMWDMKYSDSVSCPGRLLYEREESDDFPDSVESDYLSELEADEFVDLTDDDSLHFRHLSDDEDAPGVTPSSFELRSILKKKPDLQSPDPETPLAKSNATWSLAKRRVVIGQRLWYQAVEPGYLCDVTGNKFLVRFRDGKYWVDSGYMTLLHRDTASRMKSNTTALRKYPSTKSISKGRGLPGRGDLRKANRQSQSDAIASQVE